MSSPRKNKRDLTSRTVDILNRVNNTGANPQSRSKPRVRRLPSQLINRFSSRTPQVPRSDDFWEIPSEEEEIRPASKRRAAQTELRSLRRSQRARKPVQVEDTPTRSSRRLARMVKDWHKESSEEDDSEKGEELDQIIDKRLGSGLIQSVNEDRSTDVRQGRIDKERGEQEDEARRASEESRKITSPLKKRKSRTTDEQQAQEDDSEYAPDTAASEVLGEEDERGSDTTRPPESTHIIQTRRLTQELASPRATRRHTLAGQAAEQEAEEPSRKPNRRSLPVQNGRRNGMSTRDTQRDRLAELSEVPESEGDESESESSYESEAEEEEEEEEEAVATRHVPDTQREEPSIAARPSKRRRTDQYQRNPQVEVLRTQPTPPPVHSNPSTPDGNHNRMSSRHASESPAVATRPVGDILDDAQTRDNVGDKAWFKEASNIGQQNDNWLKLVDKAKELKGNIDPSQAESFGEIDKQLSKLRIKYNKINRLLKFQRSPLREDLDECEHLRKAIRNKAKEILDCVYNVSTLKRQAESKAFLKRALRLIEQFEARVFPIMIKVILLCFEAYYTNRELFPSAYQHLKRAMELLLGFCTRIVNIRLCNEIPSMRTVGYIKCEEHSQTILELLQQLIKALKDNLVQRRVNGIEGASRGEKRREWTPDEKEREWTQDEKERERTQDEKEREWTQDEKEALLDGLKQFLGEDRYDDIICHFNFGRRLRHRSPQELQTKAREIRDRYFARNPDVLRTAEGRRQWQWLLSVADAIFNEIVRKIPAVKDFTELVYENIPPEEGALICRSLEESSVVESSHARWFGHASSTWVFDGLINQSESKLLDMGVGASFLRPFTKLDLFGQHMVSGQNPNAVLSLKLSDLRDFARERMAQMGLTPA
ncbi:hypothetical protein CNMCM5793_007863 [Aspergillus hiratsukae]|uniref:Uncharacterized protein n=1 Tax=Aspergillus hiratsukae TaxID=1194566 RepID=A0A8H6V2F0_9EURO|nr:hypothetical protein CNMCM5793_007863 [Aspergillus hiratsukae]KAF7172859.1 hypothetical protein CNMCM6106_006954 [Aspergillus hiratsukae]